MKSQGEMTAFASAKRNIDIEAIRRRIHEKQMENESGNMYGVDNDADDGDEDYQPTVSTYRERDENRRENTSKAKPNHKLKTVEVFLGGRELSIAKLYNQPAKIDIPRKLTIYLSSELLDAMGDLKAEKMVRSYSWLVEEAVRQFLRNNDAGE